MKRKIILPIVICLAVVASVTAGVYTARVTMNIDPVVGATGGSELSFAPGSGGVSGNFITPDPGQSLQVILDWGQVQPNSIYMYEETLKITNNKPYAVDVEVLSVTGLTTLLNNGNMEIWHGGTAHIPHCWMWENIPSSTTRYPGTVGNKITLSHSGGTHDTAYISFRLNTNYGCPGGTYTGTVTFKAFRYQSP